MGGGRGRLANGGREGAGQAPWSKNIFSSSKIGKHKILFVNNI